MGSSQSNVVIRQLFDRESCTYTYLIGDKETKDACLIDPVIELVDRDNQELIELGFNLKYIFNTHVHADHQTGSGLLKRKWPGSKSVLGKYGNEAALADIKMDHKEKLKISDKIEIEARSTPGHTNGCVTYVLKLDDQYIAFTGDALLIRGCGRTDFQQGNSETLYKSVHEQILSLPDDTIIYPAHDYRGRTISSVLEEKTYNPRLTKPIAEFINIMKNLNLPYPKQIDDSIPMNLVCGLHELMSEEDQKKVPSHEKKSS